MRQIALFLLPLFALLPQPLAAQVLPYVFDETELISDDARGDREVDTAATEAPQADADEGSLQAVDTPPVAPAEAGDDEVDAEWEAVPPDHPDVTIDRSESEQSSISPTTYSLIFAGTRWQSPREMEPMAGRDEPALPPAAAPQGQRFVAAAPAPQRQGAAAYGPFRILDNSHAAMVGVSDERTPAAFAAMLRDYPRIATLEMVDCPGTEDDRANLRLGRMIRARGIVTHVPGNGWVASGAVELFLAGRQRSAEPGARFAVHSWEDESGRGPNDYSPNAPQNRAYIDYYRTMGMSEGEARAFYAMTNATPFSRPRPLTAGDIAQWTHFDAPAATPTAKFAQALPAPTEGGAEQAMF